MSRLGFVTALGLLATAATAHAADNPITNLQSSAGTTVAVPFNLTDFDPSHSQEFLSGFFGRAEFTSFVTGSLGSPISFDNLDISSGRNIGTFSNTTVSFTFLY